MSLFGSIQIDSNTLRAMQIGLQVVGNNIANANTPGFVREEVLYSPAPVQRVGNLTLGLGVQIDGIVQVVDKFIQNRLVGAKGDRAGAEVAEKAYQDLEVLLGELSETDLSSSLSSFFNSIDAVLDSPQDASVRNLTILKGKSLARDFNRLRLRVDNVRGSLNDRVIAAATEINDLSEKVRLLNLRIGSVEGGGAGRSEAGGLRSQRQQAVDRLSELIDIQVNEQDSGNLTITVGGEVLISDGQRRAVKAEVGDSGSPDAFILFADNDSPLKIASGEVQGLYTGRDEVFGGFITGLDEVAATLAFEFNKLHSQGQGLVGFKEVTSIENVFNTQAALDEAGLKFTPVNGAFDIQVRNTSSGQNPTHTTHTIQVDLNGLDDDTSLDDLAAAIDAIDGITATVSSTGKLSISSDSEDSDFAFAGDTSGVLAALGINTFFTGSSAIDLGVNSTLDDERLFAASSEGIDNDTRNAEVLAVFFDRSLEESDGNSLAQVYSQLVNGITQGSSIASSVADGFRVFEGTLDGEQQAVSGVNIDEEAIKMIVLQRTFQAAARHVQTVSELLEILVNL